jgi:hypothetical protein
MSLTAPDFVVYGPPKEIPMTRLPRARSFWPRLDSSGRRPASLHLILGLFVVVAFLATVGGASGSPLVLLGNTGVASNVDYNTAGVAEAFRTTASASGQLTPISIYLDSHSNASSLKLGLYTDVNRHPGALLGQGSIASPAAGAWNSATLTPTFAATAGRVYWIAVLAPVGTVTFRDVSKGSGQSEASLQTTLASLPPGWATGKTYSDGPISAFGATDLSADTQPPSVPTALAASSPTQTSVTLGWTASTDDVAVTGYGVYNGAATAGTTSTTGYTVAGLACGTSYNLVVDATDAAGNCSARATMSTSTSACPDTTPPSTPTALAANSATQTSITLGWTASTDDVAVTGYGVYKTGVRVASPPSPGYTVTTANLWMSTAGRSCTRSATAGVFNQAMSCSTAGAAYNACQPGDTVGIKVGSYGSQSVTGTKASPGCVFKADPGTTISNLNVAASWFEIDDATIGSYGWNNPSPLPSHVTFRNINMTSEVFMKGGSYISILGGSVHDFNAGNAPAAMHIEGQISTNTMMSNVLVQGVNFYNLTNTVSSNHYEVIRIDENAGNITVARNGFHDNQPNTSTIFLTSTSGGSVANWPHDVTIENNFFGATPNAYYAIATQIPTVQTCTNIKIRYNSFALTPLNTACSSGSGSQYKANIAPRDTAACASAFAFSFNVWQSNRNNPCASSDKVVIGTQFGNDQLKFVDPAHGDMHLLPGAPAIHAGDPSDYPATDFDGTARPLSGAPDAGASEAG